MAPPFKTCSVDIMYGEGISQTGELVDLAAEAGIIDKSGAWYSYNGEKIGQGRENVKDMFKRDEKLRNEISKKVRDYYFDKGSKTKEIDVDLDTGEIK